MKYQDQNDLEAILILENGSVSFEKICRLLKKEREEIEKLISKLNLHFEKMKSLLTVRVKEDTIEFFIRSDYDHAFLKHYQQKKGKLKLAALETLSIIAYRQPITLPEIDDIRGVSSVNQLKFLIDEDLVLAAGKKEAPGNPTLFKTTPHFLDRFKLKSIKDLPELKDIKSYSFLEE